MQCHMQGHSGPVRGSRRAWVGGTMIILLSCSVTACGDRDRDNVAPPAMAEVERDDGEIEFERAFPLEAEDLGDTMLISGTVVGKPAPNGFFVRTEGNQVVFVDATDSVTAGQMVRAVGPLRAIDASAFAGWERDWLGDIDPVWLVVRLHYVDADSVRKI